MTRTGFTPLDLTVEINNDKNEGVVAAGVTVVDRPRGRTRRREVRENILM